MFFTSLSNSLAGNALLLDITKGINQSWDAAVNTSVATNNISGRLPVSESSFNLFSSVSSTFVLGGLTSSDSGDDRSVMSRTMAAIRSVNLVVPIVCSQPQACVVYDTADDFSVESSHESVSSVPSTANTASDHPKFTTLQDNDSPPSESGTGRAFIGETPFTSPSPASVVNAAERVIHIPAA